MTFLILKKISICYSSEPALWRFPFKVHLDWKLKASFGASTLIPSFGALIWNHCLDCMLKASLSTKLVFRTITWVCHTSASAFLIISSSHRACILSLITPNNHLHVKETHPNAFLYWYSNTKILILIVQCFCWGGTFLCLNLSTFAAEVTQTLSGL